MKAFLRNLLAGILAIFVAFFLFLMIGSIMVNASSSDKKTKLKDNSVLHLELNKPIVEKASDNPFENLNFMDLEGGGQIGLKDLLDDIEKAKTDDRIKGIYLDIMVIQAGIASVEDIRNKLIEFAETDKFIIAYSEVYTQKAYYLASVADKVYVNKAGIVEFKGLSAQLMFFKNMLSNIGVEMQIIRGKNNKFKSAVEPFMYEKMSDANRIQTSMFMNTIWDHMIDGMASARGITADQLNEIADGILVTDAATAVEYKMADGALFEDEVFAELRSELEIEEEDEINFVSQKKYHKAKVKKEGEKASDKLKKEKVAVIYAAGEIRSGKSSNDVMGSETIVEALREARKDSSIKAIVLRVNSPGGSALASDVMWREVILAKEEKPLIVSMGDVAASGGYYISCAADKIYAQPNTITGSIGVFGTLPNMKNLLEEKIGITTDTVNTNKHSDIMTVFRPLSEEEYGIIQKGVEKVYDDFITKVSEGRGMTKEMVDSIGQGRVWAGTDAKDIGLVDEIGGLELAIDAAAKEADLEDFRTVEFPKKKDPWAQFMAEFETSMKDKAIDEELGAAKQYYEHAKRIMGMKGIQARMPFDMVIY